MRKILILLTILFIGCSSTYKVKRVIDGDTLILHNNERIRLLEVNCPELPSKEGLIAKNYTTKLLKGKRIKLTYGKYRYGKYGRTLAYVWIDNKLVNKLLIDECNCQPY